MTRLDHNRFLLFTPWVPVAQIENRWSTKLFLKNPIIILFKKNIIRAPQVLPNRTDLTYFYRALSQIARKCGTEVKNVKNVIIWGNHSSTQFPDATHATVNEHPAPQVRLGHT